jgi:phosphatidylinositol alpha-1,6-mannosyltransferase
LTTGFEAGTPGLAAITFSPRGGGIAAVSRLLRQAFLDAGGHPFPTFALAPDDSNFSTSTAQRVVFGGRVALAQWQGRCDWMMYTHLGLATIERYMPRRRRRPYAVFLHDIEAWERLPGSRRRILAGACVRLANSRYTARRVEAANPEGGPVIACPLGLPVERSESAAAAPARFEHGPQAVLIVGRMMADERYKGHDQLLEAWPAIAGVAPAARLVCVGDGDDVPRLRTKAGALGVAASVVFTGFVDDAEMGRLYAGAAVFVMPSRREGFGLVYLEAMAARVPCIGSIHDAASEVIVDGVTGYLVAQDDRPALSGRILSLLEDAGLRRTMGEAGFNRYRAEFTYEAFSRRVRAHLSTGLAAARGPARSTDEGD